MRTTLRKIIEGIDLEKSGETVDSCQDLTDLFFDCSEWIEFDGRLQMVFVRPHYCTDSWVGIRAYYLDGEFVAISNQVGRKWDQEFYFASHESFIKVKEYVLSLAPQKEYSFILAPLDDEMDDTYSVEFNCQTLHKFGTYNGSRVEIVRESRANFKDFHSQTIKYADGKTERVDCRHIKLDYVPDLKHI